MGTLKGRYAENGKKENTKDVSLHDYKILMWLIRL